MIIGVCSDLNRQADVARLDLPFDVVGSPTRALPGPPRREDQVPMQTSIWPSGCCTVSPFWTVLPLRLSCRKKRLRLLPVLQPQSPPTPLHGHLGHDLAPLMVVPEAPFHRPVSLLCPCAEAEGRHPRVGVVVLILRLVQSRQPSAQDWQGGPCPLQRQVQTKVRVLVDGAVRRVVLVEAVVPVVKPQFRLGRLGGGSGGVMNLCPSGSSGKVSWSQRANRWPSPAGSRGGFSPSP